MTWISDFTSLIYPNLCVCCGNHLLTHESFICFNCNSDLPYTQYSKLRFNPITSIFSGRMEIENATSLLHFDEGNKTQQMIHQLKYKNNPDIGVFLGQLLGKEIRGSSFYSDVDAIVPIPIHSSKLNKRGYNQSDSIANGIAEYLNAFVLDKLVIRKFKAESQTKKKRYDRWKNVSNVFELKTIPTHSLSHILIVDDVITTGATLESCAQCILKSINAKISIATLAYSI